jgi:hypothetical protein
VLHAGRRTETVFPEKGEAIERRLPVNRAFLLADHVAQGHYITFNAASSLGKATHGFSALPRFMFRDSAALAV